MCGILGLLQADGAPVDPAWLLRAATAIRHRGPDDEGFLLADLAGRHLRLCGGPDSDPALNLPPVQQAEGAYALGLAHRRLSILDLSPAGHQPMGSEDGRYWIVFNGEVYNYLELRAELADAGYAFHTGTDTEVILAAYRHWGAACVARFMGMWAFAIWDVDTRTLFLARDPFGIKPLYYVNDGRRFAFASELKSLLTLPGLSRRANPAALYDYLIEMVMDHGGDTFYAAINQLPAAHTLTVPVDAPEKAVLERYWSVRWGRNVDLSFDEAAAHLRGLFLKNIGLHLRSDVPVGMALSGGIDSSAIVSAVRHLNPAQEIHTFSYLADDPALTEEQWVTLVNNASGAVPHATRLTPQELVADLDTLIAAQDIPFGSTSIYAQHRVFRLTHDAGIKVMLDGQGADEYLAGYAHFVPFRMTSLMLQGRWGEAGRFARTMNRSPYYRGSKLKPTKIFKALPNGLRRLERDLRARMGCALDPEALKGIYKLFGVKDGSMRSAWLNQRWFLTHGVSGWFEQGYPGGEAMKGHMRAQLTESCLPGLLRYEDRNSMAYSIESRVPFLTTEIVEFVLSLPEDYILAPDGTSKAVFRQAMRGIVPDPILDRRDKIGFATPEQSLLELLRPWVESVLSSDRAAAIPALNMPGMLDEWQTVSSGARPYHQNIWRWLNVIRWAELNDVTFDA
jgi:asparagine synthase (glutamine-hydrolysing)